MCVMRALSGGGNAGSRRRNDTNHGGKENDPSRGNGVQIFTSLE